MAMVTAHLLSGLHSIHTSSDALPATGHLPASKCFFYQISAGGGQLAFQHSTTIYQDYAFNIAGWLPQRSWHLNSHFCLLIPPILFFFLLGCLSPAISWWLVSSGGILLFLLCLFSWAFLHLLLTPSGLRCWLWLLGLPPTLPPGFADALIEAQLHTSSDHYL